MLDQDNDWIAARNHRFIKKRSSFYNWKIRRKGKKDEKHNQVHPDENRRILSNWTKEQTSKHNKIIEEVWKRCDSDVTPICKKLDELQYLYDQKGKDLPYYLNSINKLITDIENNNNPSDLDLSEATVNSRNELRINKATADLKTQANSIKEAKEQIKIEGEKLLVKKKHRESIAMHNEEDIIHELTEIICIYVQGGSKYREIEIYDPLPPKTTSIPRNRHFEYFHSDYNFN